MDVDKAAKKLKHVNFSKILKLNVGGHHFSTSLATLTKDPGSMLHAMFSGRFDTKPSEDGSYFIDRDGTHFRYILNYLRTGQLVIPEDKVVRRELLVEAEFFQIEGIINELTATPFKDSAILTSLQRETLMSWLRDILPHITIPLSPVLLYRATRDGWSGANLHSHCDNKGPTVMVVTSRNIRQPFGAHDLFGIYTENQWEGTVEQVQTRESIVFKDVIKYGESYVRVEAPNTSDNCCVMLDGRPRVRQNSGFINPIVMDFLDEMEAFGFEK